MQKPGVSNSVCLWTEIYTMRKHGRNYSALLWIELTCRNLEWTILHCSGQSYHIEAWREVCHISLDRATMRNPGVSYHMLLLTELPCRRQKESTLLLLLWTKLPCASLEGCTLCCSVHIYSVVAWNNRPFIVLDVSTLLSSYTLCRSLEGTTLRFSGQRYHVENWWSGLCCFWQSYHAEAWRGLPYIALDRATMQNAK